LNLFFQKNKTERMLLPQVTGTFGDKEKRIDFVSYFIKYIKAFKHKTNENKRRPFAKLLLHHSKISKIGNGWTQKQRTKLSRNISIPFLKLKK